MNYYHMVQWVDHHDLRWSNSNKFTMENFLHSALGLGEEAGEVQGVVKKYHRSVMRRSDGLQVMSDKAIEDNQVMVDRVLEELVDVNIYVSKLFLMLEDMGISNPIAAYEQAWRNKFEVLHRRFNDITTICHYCDDTRVMAPDPDLDPELLHAIDNFLARKRNSMIERARKGEEDYHGAWRKLPAGDLYRMKHEEQIDLDNYQAMIEWQQEQTEPSLDFREV